MKRYYRRSGVLLLFLFFSLGLSGQHGWTINPSDYTYSGEVTAVVFDGGTEVTTGTLGVFVGGTCRGFADGSFFPPTGKTVFIVICYSNQVSGETLTFKYFDPSDNSTYNITETIPFVDDMTVGNASTPQQFHICNPASIITQPSDDSMCEDIGNASFTVVADGTPPFTYQWKYYNGSTWTNVANGIPAGAVYINPASATLGISGISTPANYKYQCNITNCGGGSSALSDEVTLTVIANPSAPVVSLVQPNCSTPTGSITITNPTGPGMTYSIDGSTYTNTTGIFNNVAPTSYNVTAKNSEGCISSLTNVTINAQPLTPSAPVVTLIQPSCTSATGTITINSPTGVGMTYSIDGVTYTNTTGIFSGITPGTYSVTAKSSAGCISSATSATLNAQPPTPTAPTLSLTQPTCATATGTITITAPAGLGMTYSINGVTYTNTNGIFTGVTAGTYSVTAKNSDGCVSAVTSATINAQPLTPSAPGIGLITQPSCGLNTGSVVLNTLPSGGWTIIRTPGGNIYTGTGTSTTIENLPQSTTYTFTVTNLSGCTSVPSLGVVINAQPSTPTAPTVGTITQPTCTNSNGKVVLSDLPAGTWTITRTPGGVTTQGNTSSVEISNLPADETYTFKVANSSGCISPASDPVVIDPQPLIPSAPVIGTITHPTCTVAKGSVDLSGLPGSGTWTLIRLPDGATFTGTGTTRTITDLTAGTTYLFTVTNSAGCTSPVSASVPVKPQPLTPSIPVIGTITQPGCASPTGSVVLNGLPGTGTWTITRTPGGTTPGSGTSFTVTGLTAGSYTFTVTNSDGCTSGSTTPVVITSPPEVPAAPAVGTITQPTCSLATGSVVLSGLPSSGTWTLTRNPGNVTTSGMGTSTTVTGIPAGSYTFTVTNYLGCSSASSGQVLIKDQPPSPPNPTQTVNCTLGYGKAVITVTNPTGTEYTYSLDGGIFQTSVTFSNVANGTHSITVQNSYGCLTTGPNFSVNCGCANPPTVTLSDNEGSTCGTASITISGNTFGGSASSVTLTEDGAGSLIPPSTATSPFSFTYTPAAGDAGKTVTITVTTDNPAGFPCSAATAIYTLTVNAAPNAPIVGTISQPTCSLATGSVILSGLPGTGTWTLLRTPGGTITTGSGTSATISGLTANTYTFTVTNAAGCISAPSANVIISSQPPTPDPPVVGTITQPNCAVSTGSVVLSGLPATGTWTLIRTPGGTITSGNGTSVTVSNIPQNNTYTYTVTNSFGCKSDPSEDIEIKAQPATPSAPIVGTITQPTCSVSTGSVVLSGLPVSGTWTLTRLPDVVNLTGSGTTTTVTGIPSGTHVYTVTNSDGCTSAVSGSVKINPPLTVPAAPAINSITQPGCTVSTGSVLLTGLPSTGTWTLLRSPDNITTTGNGSSVTISGLTTNTYTFRVTNSDNCTSVSSANVVINAQPPTPAAPVVGTITQPNCAVSTGTVLLSGLPASGTWTLTRTPGPATITGTGTSRTVTGIPAGSYTFTVTNSNGCISASSEVVVIDPQPVTPSAPVIGPVTQTTCTESTGKVEITGLPASGTWTLTRYPDVATFTGSGTSITITNLTPDTYTFRVTNSDGCTSVSSASVTINPQPPTPSAPVIGTITQPTCSVATGSVVVSGLPTAGWTLTRYPSGNTLTGTGTSVTISGLTAGSYTFTVTNLTSCTSPLSAPALINNQPPTPTTPVQSVDCTLGYGKAVVTVTSPTGSGYEYRIDVGSYQSSNVFSNVANGSHTITVKNSDGCTTTGASFIISCGCINPPTLTLNGTSGSTCSITPVTVSGNIFGGSATSVTITENGAGTINPVSSTSSPFSFTYTPAAGDIGNTIIITVTTNNPIGNPPCAAATSTYTLKVNALPAAPTIGSITHPTCSSATGSVILSGLPSVGNWTITHVQGGETITGSGTSTSVTGLSTGTHNFTVTNSLGCTSLQSANVVINSQPVTPTPPVIGTVTHPTCNVSTGSVALSGLPATGTWTITRLPAGTTTTGTGTTRTITGIIAGTHTFIVRNASGCSSSESDQVVINEQPETPSAPIIDSIAQPNCTVSTGQIYLSGLPATGIWTLTRYTEGVTTTGTGTTYVVSGLTAGTYNFTVKNAVGCTSVVSSSAKVNAQPPTPTTPVVGTITHPTFSVPTGSVVLSGLPSSGTWTITRLPDNVKTTGTGTSKTLTGLEPGDYTFTVTNSFGCTSAPTAKVTINARPGPPKVVITNPPTICSNETTDLTLPAVTEGSDANLTFTYWLNSGATTPLDTPEAAPPGIYYIKGTSTAGYSTIKQVVVSADQMPVADAGPDEELNYVLETTLNAAYLDHGTGLWSLVTGSGNIENETDTLTGVTGLSIGTNRFRWTVSNGACPDVSDEVVILVNDLLIPTMITPNGDPYNEYFVLYGLEETLGKTELVIFDRRGMQVFRSANYDNDWNGLDDNGKELPEDTYFWVLRSANGKSLSGFVVIRR
ncbi:MAG TPA: gliding motility-associated C-terminal domain-containing protein [Bacteroidales bacterium]|nr:gliding motility-associated C-terminal domain-containing protein [Bacteroidales bacterium]